MSDVKEKYTICYIDGREPKDDEVGYPSFKAFVEANKHLLQGAEITGQDLSGINLSGANLSGCNFERCKMSGINLERCQIIGSNFSSTDLTGARMKDATIDKTNFDHSCLKDADCRRVVGHKTSFVKSDISGADFAESYFKNANFTGVKVDSISASKIRGYLSHDDLWANARSDSGHYSSGELPKPLSTDRLAVRTISTVAGVGGAALGKAGLTAGFAALMPVLPHAAVIGAVGGIGGIVAYKIAESVHAEFVMDWLKDTVGEQIKESVGEPVSSFVGSVFGTASNAIKHYTHENPSKKLEELRCLYMDSKRGAREMRSAFKSVGIDLRNADSTHAKGEQLDERGYELIVCDRHELDRAFMALSREQEGRRCKAIIYRSDAVEKPGSGYPSIVHFGNAVSKAFFLDGAGGGVSISYGYDGLPDRLTWSDAKGAKLFDVSDKEILNRLRLPTRSEMAQGMLTSLNPKIKPETTKLNFAKSEDRNAAIRAMGVQESSVQRISRPETKEQYLVVSNQQGRFNPDNMKGPAAISQKGAVLHYRQGNEIKKVGYVDLGRLQQSLAKFASSSEHEYESSPAVRHP